jgi:predicted nucleic acid-binding protein
MRAVTLFAEGKLDYADAFAAAMMTHRREPHAFSFDKDFDGMPGIVRHGELPAAER